MAHSVNFLFYVLTIFLAFCSVPCGALAQHPCATYKFSDGRQFSSCSDLPVLDSSLHWTYHPSSNSFNVAFRHTVINDRRWIAWAINPTSAGMLGSQAVVSFPRTDGNLVVYTSPIASYGTRLEEGNLSFPVFDLSATYDNGEMIIFASLQLFGNTTTVNHLWQVGPLSENTPMMHSVAPSSPNVKCMGSLDFLSGRITTRIPTNTLKIVHGILNTISWGILMPVGAVIARYMKSQGPLWFYLHMSCQLLAYGLGGLAGFGTGIVLGRRSRGIEQSSHKIIGIVVFCLATAQVFVGICRPGKDSKHRFYFNWFHYLVGYSTLVLSIFNIFKGLQILQAANFWRVAYIAVIGVLGCVVILFEIYACYSRITGRKRNATIDKNTISIENVAAVEVV